MVLILAAAFFLVLAVHPLVFYPLSLLLAQRKKTTNPIIETPRPSISLCLSAFNEEQVIVSKVENLLAVAAAYGPAKIHVYVDGAEDRTAELLVPFADKIDLVFSNERRGKTAGMNILVSRSDSEILAFTDANVIIPPDGLIKLAAALADPTVGCASARLRYTNPGETSTSLIGAIYWRIEEAIKSIETDTVGVVGVDGAFFAIRRDIYEPAPENLIDDLYVSLCALTRGTRVVSTDVEVTERNAATTGEEFERKTRIACQAMNVHRVLWPRLSRMAPLPLYGYISHRLLKWLMPFNLGFCAVFVLWFLVGRLGWVTVSASAVVVSLLTALGAILGVKPFRLALSILASFAGVVWGVLQSVGGRTFYTVWSPASSARTFEPPPRRPNSLGQSIGGAE